MFSSDQRSTQVSFFKQSMRDSFASSFFRSEKNLDTTATNQEQQMASGSVLRLKRNKVALFKPLSNDIASLLDDYHTDDLKNTMARTKL